VKLRQKKYDGLDSLLHLFEVNGGDKSGSLYYYYKGGYYAGINKSDSAIYYYRMLLRESVDIHQVEMACRGLVKTFEQSNKPDSTMKYALLYTNASDSVGRKKSSEELLRMRTMYENNESMRRTIEEMEFNVFSTKLMTIAICLVFSIMYVVSVYYTRKKRIEAEKLAEVNAAYSSLLKQYEDQKRRAAQLESDIDERKRETQEELQKLRKELLAYQKDDDSEEDVEIEETLLDNEIIIRFHSLAAKVKYPTEDDWEQLYGFVLTSMSDFYQKISSQKYHLNNIEIRAAILIRLHFIPSELVALMNLSKQRVTNIRANINKKVFHVDGAKNIDKNICSM